MRFVQDVEVGDATRPKLALLYWICRRSDKGRDRGRIKAVIVIRERESWPLFVIRVRDRRNTVIVFRRTARVRDSR
jgi:hypothetical protein